jgi:hypothetical protein
MCIVNFSYEPSTPFGFSSHIDKNLIIFIKNNRIIILHDTFYFHFSPVLKLVFSPATSGTLPP